MRTGQGTRQADEQETGNGDAAEAGETAHNDSPSASHKGNSSAHSLGSKLLAAMPGRSIDAQDSGGDRDDSLSLRQVVMK